MPTRLATTLCLVRAGSHRRRTEGRRLIAHELTHVVQQRGPPPPPPGRAPGGRGPSPQTN